MKLQRRHDRGSAIALALVVVLLLAGMGAAMGTLCLKQNSLSLEADLSLQALYAAEAALEETRLLVAASATDVNGNLWLNSVANPAAGGDPREIAPSDKRALTRRLDANQVTVEGCVYSLDTQSKKFRVLARAVCSDKQTLTVSQDVRAWDTFARFATFADRDTLQFGATTMHGHVHSNQGIVFHYGGADFTDQVSASNGFSFQNGANPGNTHLAFPNPHVKPIGMPTLGDLNTLGQYANGMLNVAGTNFQYGNAGEKINASLEFQGDQVILTAVNQQTGAVVSGSYPLPQDGVLFVDGNITSVKGRISSRVTLSATGSMTITDKLIYVDGSGQPAYLLTQNGVPVANNDTASGIAWTTGAGFDYVPNPDYKPDPKNKPSLGLIAGEQITIAQEAPRNMEIHASLFSVNSTWSADLTLAKDNLRIVGSIAARYAGARAQGIGGYSLSGGYIYDQDLVENPPPHYPKVFSPFWGPRFKTRQT